MTELSGRFCRYHGFYLIRRVEDYICRFSLLAPIMAIDLNIISIAL